MTEISRVYCTGDLTCLKQRSWSDTPPWPADGKQNMVAIFTTRVRRKLPLIGESDVRLTHQLAGKPAAGAGGK